MYFFYGFDVDHQLSVDPEELLRGQQVFQLIEIVVQQVAVAAEVDGIAELSIRVIIGGRGCFEIVQLLSSFDQQTLFIPKETRATGILDLPGAIILSWAMKKGFCRIGG